MWLGRHVLGKRVAGMRRSLRDWATTCGTVGRTWGIKMENIGPVLGYHCTAFMALILVSCV